MFRKAKLIHYSIKQQQNFQIAADLEALFCLKALNDFVQNVKVPEIRDFGDLYILHKIVEGLEAKK